MEYIDGVCQTNLDNYDTKVVSKFAKVPEKGDRVSVLYKGNRTTLKVVDITHDQSNGKPFIHVELHN